MTDFYDCGQKYDPETSPLPVAADLPALRLLARRWRMRGLRPIDLVDHLENQKTFEALLDVIGRAGGDDIPSRLEAQAAALDVLFRGKLMRALDVERWGGSEDIDIALKAQSQCRMTARTLRDLARKERQHNRKITTNEVIESMENQ